MKTQQLKLQLIIPIMLTVMVLCMGCPYESKFPLEGTRVRYDKNLIGTWHEGETDLKIIRVDDYKFSYVYNDHDDEYGAGEETGTGYAVTNGGNTYLVAERDNGSSYAIYKVLSIETNGLHVVPLEEDVIPESKKFNSASEFTSYVINNGSTTFAYKNKADFSKGVSSWAGVKTNPSTNNNTSTNNNSYSSNNYSGGGTILFREDYQTRTNNWYSNYDFKDSNYIYINTLDNPSNHTYLFRNRKRSGGGYIVPIPYYSIPRSGYSIEINAQHYDGVEDAGYGVKFGASGWTNCYNFNISANGYYRISKNENGVYSNLVTWTTSSIINKGSGTNKLEVRVYSNYTEFYINGQYLRRLDIVPFGSTAGLEVYNYQTIYYDDLFIRSLSGGSNNNIASNTNGIAPGSNTNTNTNTNTNNNASADVLFRENYQTFSNNWYSNYDFKDSNYIYIATLDNPNNHYYLFRNRRRSGDNFIVPIPYFSIPNAYYSIEINARHFDGTDEHGYGVVFAASDLRNSYSLNITNNGYYRISKMNNGTYSNLVSWTSSSALRKGNDATNKLEIRVYYTYVDIYINGQYVTRQNDFTRYGNNAGLEVYNYQTIYYDDLLIKKL